MPLGYVAAAPVADAIGTDTTLIGLAALTTSACIGILLVPGVRNMRRPDDGAIPDESAQPIGADAVEDANPA